MKKTTLVAVVAAIVALGLAACSSGGGASGPTPGKVAIHVAVSGGTITGPRSPSVKQGTRVELTVDADVADEVHVHGYDLMKEVAPGRPAVISFTADIPGTFEIELENAGRLVLTLQVQP